MYGGDHIFYRVRIRELAFASPRASVVEGKSVESFFHQSLAKSKHVCVVSRKPMTKDDCWQLSDSRGFVEESMYIRIFALKYDWNWINHLPITQLALSPNGA
jgi:hypothetical protein